MTQKRVLVVEDERPIREMLTFNLTRAGFDVAAVGSGKEARAQIADQFPDLILMDWMLPDISGLELTRQIKRDKNTREIPVIMVTARAAEDDRVTGLDGGADDYVSKPFSPRELVARIRAALRRGGMGEDEQISLGGLTLDLAGHRVLADGTAIGLGPTEYRLLAFFMQHPERVYTRTQLLDRVWGGDVYVEERTVDVHIRRLRKAMEPFGLDSLIRTVRGAGYSLTLVKAQGPAGPALN